MPTFASSALACVLGEKFAQAVVGPARRRIPFRSAGHQRALPQHPAGHGRRQRPGYRQPIRGDPPLGRAASCPRGRLQHRVRPERRAARRSYTRDTGPGPGHPVRNQQGSHREARQPIRAGGRHPGRHRPPLHPRRGRRYRFAGCPSVLQAGGAGRAGPGRGRHPSREPGDGARYHRRSRLGPGSDPAGRAGRPWRGWPR